jgi:hypothetical protein
MRFFAWLPAAVAAIAAATAFAQDFSVSKDEYETPDEPYSPYVNDHYPQNAYFGDTHLHTALRDPDGANLDRIQVIKGWLDGEGNTHEQIYDIACADRGIVDGACDGDVGSTVNVQEATYTNTIGDAALAGHWEDPDFDPSQKAFYYVRVIQIPSPRWSTYDAKYFDIEIPEGTPTTVQDRAYTSPIWYTPKS